MIKYAAVLLIIFSFTASAQFEIRGGMGIDFVSSPSLQDYINQNYASSADQLGSFNAAIDFSVEAGYRLKENFQLGIEMAYLINSYNFPSLIGTYDFSYNIFSPTATAYYVVAGTGYSFKFGGGVGPRFVMIDEKLPGRQAADSYSSTGFGFLLRVDGNTLLGGNVYANIGADLRYDINGEPKNGSTPIFNNAVKENVNINSFSAGIRLGVSYYF